MDASHIQSYWQQHVGLVQTGIDAFWPDEGDWFDLFERVKRHQLYYQGSLQTTPNVRPWSLQRNGFPGIAQWGGWVWSGDTDTSWKTLEAQIAVGLNYSMSIGPYWGSDIGGFYPNREYTGELYARWFQFAAFCGSFRAHGRVWQMRLPWGWGGKELGPLEYGNNNQAPPPGDARNIDPAELGNPAIEPIAKRYAELRYQLMPYTYTLAREARDRGLPLMRAMWLHYPTDATARAKGDQFLWGRDLLIAPVYTKGATTPLRLSAGRRLVRLVDQGARGRRPHHRSRGRSRDDADLRARGRDRAGRSDPAVHGRARLRADVAARLPGRQRRVHALRRRRDQPGVSGRARQLDPDDLERCDAHADARSRRAGGRDRRRPSARVPRGAARRHGEGRLYTGRRVSVAF